MEGVSMMYAKFFPSDWRTGCLTLTLEEEGLYIRVCAYMYDTGKAVPADYSQAAYLLRVQIHKYKKVMDSLIAKGKMIRAQGYIINERVQEEWHRYLMQMKIREEAAKKREATRKRLAEEVERAILEKRAEGQTPHHTPHLTPPDNPPSKVGGKVEVTPLEESELPNEINEGEPRVKQTLAHKLESRIQKLESKSSSSNEELVPDGTSPRDALEAFEAYNNLALKVGLPQARTLTPQRRKNLMARLREHGGLEAWGIALANIERSAFLRGRNDRGWRCDLDFLLQASRFAKVVDGTYGNGAHAEDPEHPEETPQQRNRRLMAEAVEQEKRHGR
jgi:uncharacterized protein YdaU (DUF1376 family)